MESRGLILFIGLLLGLALRLYPLYHFSTPFSTDGWPIISNTEKLLRSSPIDLRSEVFDGYNNYWPASMLFGAAASEILGLPPPASLGLLLPVAGWVGLLAFYIIARRMLNGLAELATLILAVIPNFTVFMAGVTKEAYAAPLYLLMLYLVLYRPSPLFIILSLGLVTSHHLTLLTTLTVIALIAMVRVGASIMRKPEVRLKPLYPPIALLLISIPYYIFFAGEGIKYPLEAPDIISYASYVMLSLVILARVPAQGRWVRRTAFVLGLLGLLGVILLLATRPIFPGMRPLGAELVVYSVPTLTLIPLALRTIVDSRSPEISAWLAAPVGLGLYALFSATPVSPILLVRAQNFLYPLLALLAVMSLRGVRGVVRGLLMMFLVASSIYVVYIAYDVGSEALAYQWRYVRGEFIGCWHISEHCDGCVFLGDIKVKYLLEGYFDVSVDVFGGYNLLVRGAKLNGGFVLYPDMLRHGYLIGMHPSKVGFEGLGRLSLVYFGFLRVYWGVEG